MLRHPGDRRKLNHNIPLAALLCLTAGFVNVAGFRAFLTLTTNITGHVALLAEELATGDFASARIVALWMILFFVGGFLCSLWINRAGRFRRYAYTFPILIEIIILLLTAFLSQRMEHPGQHAAWFAGILLFAMGVQNATVSMISGSVVRTTHLTGMFTDLGIELAAASNPGTRDKRQLKQKIILRLVIIVSFLVGGIAGGYLFTPLRYAAFYIPAGILFFALFYDIFRIQLLRWMRGIRR